MKRSLLNSLITWKASVARKPLILQGARQVGKTHLVLAFAKAHFSDVVHLNFEERPNLAACFKGSLDPLKIIELLEVAAERKIDPKQTLIFFDEVQRCPEALTSLKYFCEKAPQYHIICAGSLLGISVAGTSSFPVGKVDFLRLYPLTFQEFLSGIEKSFLAEYLTALEDSEPANATFHSELLQLFSFYLFIGGMPEVVASYASLRDLTRVREIQHAILQAYQSDFSKYVDPPETLKIHRLWESVPQQLARENKKFIFSAIAKSARAREYEVGLQWLLDAGLILKSTLCKMGESPLPTHCMSDSYKVFALDVGLLGAMVRVSQQSILSKEELFTQFNGALFENFVAQELVAYGHEPLYYWSSGAQAEVDFLVEQNGRVVPVEVKSGTSLRSKSLQVYLKRYNPKLALRLSHSEQKRAGSILELPVYRIAEIRRLVSAS